MPNPNLFQFEIDGKTCYADPLRVRRLLLQNTFGKCWGLTREVNNTATEIVKARDQIVSLEKDLATNPTTPDELEKIKVIQTETAEGKQHTIPFHELPRQYQLDGWQAQIAILSQRQAEMEGVLANAAFAAFDLPPIDLDKGEGVTEQEALNVLKQFIEYAEGKGERLGS